MQMVLQKVTKLTKDGAVLGFEFRIPDFPLGDLKTESGPGSGSSPWSSHLSNLRFLR